MLRPTWLLVVAGLVVGIGVPPGSAILCKGRSGVLRVRDACKRLEVEVGAGTLLGGAIYTRSSTLTANACVSVESRCDRASDILLSCEGGQAQSSGNAALQSLRRDGVVCDFKLNDARHPSDYDNRIIVLAPQSHTQRLFTHVTAQELWNGPRDSHLPGPSG